MKMNLDQLVMQSVLGKVSHPKLKKDGYWVGYDGKGRICMSTGGITYNFKIGDICMGLAGDHIEPGVSLINENDGQNQAFMTYSCIGNEVKVLSGEAKGSIGYVSGKHGGVNHVMAYFDNSIIQKLSLKDEFEIRVFGQGLKLIDYPQIAVMNINPHLLSKIAVKEENSILSFPVVTVIPAHLMGAGLGSTTLWNGDYDIMCHDKEEIKLYGLDTLRFGDFVCIENHYCANGATFQRNYYTIGVITHSDSFTSGHGPGVTVIMSGPKEALQPYIDKNMNLKQYI